MTDGMIGDIYTDHAIPTLHGALVGFRRWGIQGDRLVSPHISGGSWDPGVNIARCKGRPHPKKAECRIANLAPSLAQMFLGSHALVMSQKMENQIIPHKDCHCGLYAYHNPEQILEGPNQHFAGIAGAVLLFGQIEVHRNGFRAEKAYPILLVEPQNPVTRKLLDRWQGDWDAQLQSIVNRYRVKLVAGEDLWSQAVKLGRPWSADLLP